MIAAVLLFAAAASALAPAEPAVISAVRLCLAATSRAGSDPTGLTSAGWARQAPQEGRADPLFRKDGMTVSLGTRPGVGGSCIIGYRTPPGPDPQRLAVTLARTLSGRLAASVLLLPGKFVMLERFPTPTGDHALIAIETAPPPPPPARPPADEPDRR